MIQCKACQETKATIYNDLLDEMVCETCHWAIQVVDLHLKMFALSCLKGHEVGLELFAQPQMTPRRWCQINLSDSLSENDRIYFLS